MYVKKNLYVDEEVWREFIAYVSRKHGKLKGKLCEELSKALKEYLEHAHTDSGKPEDEKPKSRTLKTLRDISEKLGEYKEVTDQDVEDVIVKTVGGDHRTVSKYRYLLQKLGVIEPSRRIVGSNGWIYTVQPRLM
jgi:rRNA maturation endonuclease Nob1